MHHQTKKEKVQCWLALLLTCGEFVGGFWIIFKHGNFFYIYLAITYALRETTGGKHYHNIIVEACHKLRRHKEHVDDNPFYNK